MWTYEQGTGRMLHNGVFIWTGYSGHDGGRNNGAMQRMAKVGPIPLGRYRFGVASDGHPKLGPYVIPIWAMQGTDTFGRFGFFLHGDDAEHDASEGCIIKSPKTAREMIGESGDNDLEVIA